MRLPIGSIQEPYGRRCSRTVLRADRGGPSPGPTRLTESGGSQPVGTIKSLLETCQLHEVDACTYRIDVLQHLSVHLISRAIELTPRMWKSLFADDHLRSNLGPHFRDPQSH